MECTTHIEKALKDGDISSQLYQGSSNSEIIIDLQKTLFELGFRKELKWDKYGADGDYGAATAAAVRAFAEKNNNSANGKKVTKTLAKLILQRHDFLPAMYIVSGIHSADLRTRRYVSRGTKMSIVAIQVLLNEIGYGRQLNFAKYGADGLYGKSTKKAIIKFANDNGVASDGDLITRPFANLLMDSINVYYGKKWSEQAKNNMPNDSSPLIIFDGDRFVGKPCRADVQFLPSLNKINDYAERANVYIYVTSSFRTTTNVDGAIVKPATYSNHLAGHGIDMNVKYGNGKLANSTMLKKYPNVPAPVKKFLKFIIDDSTLRWGGTFSSTDPVHIDDWLNKDKRKWRKRYQAMQKAVQLGE